MPKSYTSCKFAFFASLVLFLSFWSAKGISAEEQKNHPAALSPEQRASKGIEVLQQWYDPATGQYKTTGWWNSGNATTVLVDYARQAKSNAYNKTFAEIFTNAQKSNPGFLNKYYDDEGWWALAWIDAFDLTGNQEYLSMAKSIFADMTKGWDNTCGGGIWWNKYRRYKNAITNELFFSIAAHLANRDASNDTQYLDWANKEWKWFQKSGMINDQGLINDGLGTSNGETSATECQNNKQNTWSYNQGVILDGFVELSKLNSDPELLNTANKIATAAITSLVDSKGVMHDVCEPNCGADGVQFKGIFVRNLVHLYSVTPQVKYKAFLTTNANSIWEKSQGPGYQFGQVWSGPFDAGNAGSQSSALDALVGAAIVEGK